MKKLINYFNDCWPLLSSILIWVLKGSMRNVVKNRFPGSLNGDWEMILKAGLGITEKMRLANYC
jgi:hypothetical protein